jgi:Tol biopolymer transport system component
MAFSAAGPDGNIDIYVQQIGAGNPLRLTTDPAPDWSPVFSPDGRYIAFTRKGTLILIPSLGGAERELGPLSGVGIGFLSGWQDDCHRQPGFQPRQKRSGSFLFPWKQASASESLPLRRPPSDHDPRFSPDGRSIAFARSSARRVPSWIRCRRWWRRKTSGRRQSGDRGPRMDAGWRRDRVFHRRLGRPEGVVESRASGGTPQPVSEAGENAYYPAVSRTEKRLAYVHRPTTRTSGKWI